MNIQFGWSQLGVLLMFAGICLAITFLLSYISGWAMLARHYRAIRPFAGRYERIRSSQMGPLGPFGGARNALYLGVDADGLHLRMFILFRLNCRDLFMPWQQVAVLRGKSFFLEYVEFRFSRSPKIGVRIYGTAGEVIRALAGPAWPAEAPHDVVQR
jgi:hypothetical protein